jgi:uncharacterized membrane protein
MNPVLVLFIALGIGFVCGLRAFAPLALVSWLANWGWMPLAGSHLAFLGTTAGAVTVSVIALAELAGDKWPKTPKRTEAGPLAARMVAGAMCAVAVFNAAGESLLLGIVCGAIGSVGGAFAGYHIRRALVSRLRVPDFVVALVEDIVAIGGSLFLFARFFFKSI